jgi:hypothetical protein
MNFEEICSNFFNDNKNLSASLLVSYHKSVNGKQNTKSNLVNYIINSPEFNSHVNTTIDKLLINIFDQDYITNDIPKYDTLKKHILTSLIVKTAKVDLKEIQTFVKNQNIFIDYFNEIIKNLYKYFYKSDIVKEDSETILLLVNEFDFNTFEKKVLINKLNEYIHKLNDVSKEKKKPLTEINHFHTSYKNKFNKEPGIKEIKEYTNFMSEETHIVNMYFNQKFNHQSVFFKDVTTTFEKLFERDITVFEYVKYYDNFQYEDEIHLYLKLYTERFKIGYNIFNNYLNEKLDYLVFTKYFLHLIDYENEPFKENVINIVTQFDSYKNVMISKIANIYKKSFTNTISLVDVTYFFDKVLERKLNLIDDNLTKLISELKDETDIFNGTIISIFKNILNREADEVELSMYVLYFRDSVINLKATIRLEDELYESLEYHDILKNIILKEYLKKEVVPRSTLFKMLDLVIKNENTKCKRDKHKIFELLTKNGF